MKKQFAFMLEEPLKKALLSEANRRQRSMGYLINHYITRCALRDIEKAKNLEKSGKRQTVEEMDEEENLT